MYKLWNSYQTVKPLNECEANDFLRGWWEPLSTKGVGVIDADSTLNSEVWNNVGSMSTHVYAISLFVLNMVEISSFWFLYNRSFWTITHWQAVLLVLQYIK